jgi:type I restriction enzyme M protein
LAAIRPHGINRDFLFYVLRAQEDEIRGNGGEVFDSINRKQIEALVVPLPPIAIQERIVAEVQDYLNAISAARSTIQTSESGISQLITGLWNE